MIRSTLLRGFDWSGRARRRELWAFLLFVAVLLAAFTAIELWLSGGAPTAPRFVYLLAAAILVPLVSLAVRRLHDRGHSGGWLALALVPWLGLAVSAYLLFAPTDSRADPPDTPAFLNLLGALTTALVVLLVASRVFWAPFWIVSGSMKPSLLPGDYVIVRFTDARSLARGDVIAFRDPQHNVDFVARLIALPGDTVQLQAGQILLNSQTLIQTPQSPFHEVFVPQGPNGILPRCGNAPVGAGGQCQTARLTETNAEGRSYAVLDLVANGPGDDTPIVTVPPGAYFVLGDNRDDSFDSRIAVAAGGIGMVADKDIIGRARRIVFSPAGAQALAFWQWRSGRYGLAVP